MRFRDTMSSVLLAALVAAAGCSEDTETMTAQPDASTADAAPSVTPWDELLAQRQQNYGQALRVASLKLRGGLPTLAETKAVTESGDPDGAYRAVLQTYLEDPRFAVQMRNFFRDSFRMGGGQLDTAPSFAAQLVVEDRNFTELFTASAQTCPTLDEATGQFAPGECTSGAPQTAGLLTNPHVMRHFFSNMAFRRVMWLQETFVCTKFPAEVDVPQDVGGAAAYVAPWAFDSVAGTETGGVIDFRDAESVVCANCHGTMNHQAPLFARFDEEGMWQTDYAVPTPAEGAPTVRFEDYLATGGNAGLALRPTGRRPGRLRTGDGRRPRRRRVHGGARVEPGHGQGRHRRGPGPRPAGRHRQPGHHVPDQRTQAQGRDLRGVHQRRFPQVVGARQP